MRLRCLAYRILGSLFRHEEIPGDGRVERYMNRWTLWKGREGRSLYLHHFVGSDWSRDVHDHPKAFLSIGLLGRYAEVSPGRGPRVYRAPWVRRFPATHRHRIVLADGETCWTLVYVGPTEREWGFWLVVHDYVSDRWIRWDEYVFSSRADRRIARERHNRAALRELRNARG